MATRQMEEIQKKLATLNYPRANAPAQSLLFAGMERYALLEWLFFRSSQLPFFLLDLSFAHCFTSCFQIIRFEIISILGFLREFDLNWYVADYWVINHRSRNKVSKGMPWFATKRLLASNVSLLIHYRSAGLSTLADWFLSFTWHGCFIWVLYVAHERLMSMILTDLHCAKILKFIIRHVSIMALIPVIHILSTL
jgi:hypothetical protein